MKTKKRALIIVTVIAGMLAAAPTAQSPQAPAGPDLSGRWTRTSAGGADRAGYNAGWGPEVTVEQNGTELTVRSGAAQPQRYKTDGTELWHGALERAMQPRRVA